MEQESQDKGRRAHLHCLRLADGKIAPTSTYRVTGHAHACQWIAPELRNAENVGVLSFATSGAVACLGRHTFSS